MPGSDVPERFTVDFTGELLLGQYRVLEKVADGGMGAVYVGTDENLGRKVAVKVPHPRFLGEEGFRQRFATEVEELIRLEHPHIARILARGEHDQVPFFILQFLGGGDLEDRIAAGRMSPAEVVPWLLTTAETLDFVHARGIVHRDVKPANILFDEDGHVFLSDFGVAKAMTGEGGGLTATGMGIGSPKYMAPEQGLAKDVGPAADQYGLASTVYEALAGEPPYGGDDPLRVLVRKQQEDPAPLDEVAPNVPPGAAAAVMRALSRDPAERYGSCMEFAEAFSGALSTTTLPAVEPPREEGVTVDLTLTGAKAFLLLGAILGVLALAVVGVVLLVGDGESAPPETKADAGGTHPGQRTFVDLLEPGAEPRRKLRYRVAEGARERMRMNWLAEMSLELGDKDLSSPGAVPMVFDSSVAIDSVADSGEIGYHWTLEECRVPVTGDDPSSAHVAENLMKPLKQIEGLTAEGRLGPRGADHQLTFPGVEENGPVAQRFLGGISEGLRKLCVPLPEEAVGVGAKWDVTEMLEVGGMRFTGTTRYELVSIEGWRIRVAFSAAMMALGQEVFPPGFEGVEEFEAKSHRAACEGESLIDLTQLVPRSSTVRDEMWMEGTMAHDGMKQEFKMHNVVTTVLERR